MLLLRIIEKLVIYFLVLSEKPYLKSEQLVIAGILMIPLSN
jgi:hypothetical protein